MNSSKLQKAARALADLRREYTAFTFAAQRAMDAINALTPAGVESDNPAAVLIISRVCAHFEMNVCAVLSPARPRHLADARHMAMLLLRDLTPLTYQQIGGIFHRDHGTVIHGERHARQLLVTDASYRAAHEVLVADLAPAIAALPKAA